MTFWKSKKNVGKVKPKKEKPKLVDFTQFNLPTPYFSIDDFQTRIRPIDGCSSSFIPLGTTEITGLKIYSSSIEIIFEKEYTENTVPYSDKFYGLKIEVGENSRRIKFIHSNSELESTDDVMNAFQKAAIMLGHMAANLMQSHNQISSLHKYGKERIEKTDVESNPL